MLTSRAPFPALLLPLLAAGLLLPGCSGEFGNIPSLAIRDVERADRQADEEAKKLAEAEAEANPKPVALNPELEKALALLLDNARSESAAIGKALEKAEPVLERARSSGPGSDAWFQGQAALSAVLSSRQKLVDIRSQADMMYIERLHGEVAGELPWGSAPAIDQTRQEIDALLASSDSNIDRYQDLL